MDCFFQLNVNSFTIGAVSPLNSGWYLAIPSKTAYEDMRAKAIWRLGRDWDEINGWGEKMPQELTVRGGKPVGKWQFNGCDMDQGLFTHYFVINHGKAMLVDTQLRKARRYELGLAHAPQVELPLSEALQCCKGRLPTAHFAHFTGRSKPWLKEDLAALQPSNSESGLNCVERAPGRLTAGPQ